MELCVWCLLHSLLLHTDGYIYLHKTYCQRNGTSKVAKQTFLYAKFCNVSSIEISIGSTSSITILLK